MTASSGSIGSRYRMLAWVARWAAMTKATGRTTGSSRRQLRKLKASESNAHTKIGKVRIEMIHFCRTGVDGAGHGVKNLRKGRCPAQPGSRDSRKYSGRQHRHGRARPGPQSTRTPPGRIDRPVEAVLLVRFAVFQDRGDPAGEVEPDEFSVEGIIVQPPRAHQRDIDREIDRHAPCRQSRPRRRSDKRRCREHQRVDEVQRRPRQIGQHKHQRRCGDLVSVEAAQAPA